VKYTVIVVEPGIETRCSNLLDSREEATEWMNELFEVALENEGLMPDEFEEALGEYTGGDSINADELLGSGYYFQVTAIYGSQP